MNNFCPGSRFSPRVFRRGEAKPGRGKNGLLHKKQPIPSPFPVNRAADRRAVFDRILHSVQSTVKIHVFHLFHRVIPIPPLGKGRLFHRARPLGARIPAKTAFSPGFREKFSPSELWKGRKTLKAAGHNILCPRRSRPVQPPGAAGQEAVKWQGKNV